MSRKPKVVTRGGQYVAEPGVPDLAAKIDRLAEHGTDDVRADLILDEIAAIVFESEAVRFWIEKLEERAADVSRRAEANPVLRAEHADFLTDLSTMEAALGRARVKMLPFGDIVKKWEG